MTNACIIGQTDPILEVTLAPGEAFFAESGAMLAMDQTLSLTGAAKGGFFASLGRAVLHEESFFQEKIAAKSESGKILLSPLFPGGIAELEVGASQYRIADGCYLASEEGVAFETKTQGLGKAIFGKTGGFFVLGTKGRGKVYVSGFGSIHEIEVTPGKPVVADNGHVVAWDAGLDYELSLGTGGSGLLGKIVHSQISGEGLMLKFTGAGKIWVSSRNRPGFIAWILRQIPTPSKNDR